MAELSKEHQQVLKAFLAFRNQHRDLLMKGEFTVRGIENNDSYTEVRLDDQRIALFTTTPIIRLEQELSEDYAINLSGGDEVFITGATDGVKYEIFDCAGKRLCRLKALRKADRILAVPHAGLIRFVR